MRGILLLIVAVAAMMLICTPVAGQDGQQPISDNVTVLQQTAPGVASPAQQGCAECARRASQQQRPSLVYVPVSPPGIGWARPGIFGSVVYRQRVWTGRPWIWRPFAPRYIPRPPVVMPGVLYRSAIIQ
jgi:hypothetical protein